MPAVAASPLVRVKGKSQITLPVALRRHFEIEEGDVLEATSTEGGILLTPKALVDRSTAREIELGLADLRHGRVIGPFKSAAALHRAVRTKKPRRA